MTIDPKEGHLLALRLKIQLQPMGIDLDTDLFTEMLNEDNDIGNILRFCGEVLYAQLGDQNEASIESSFEDLSEDEFSQGPTDFATFCKQLSTMTEEELEEDGKNIKMSLEDKMSMFTVQEKYSKGKLILCFLNLCILSMLNLC